MHMSVIDNHDNKLQFVQQKIHTQTWRHLSKCTLANIQRSKMDKFYRAADKDLTKNHRIAVISLICNLTRLFNVSQIVNRKPC